MTRGAPLKRVRSLRHELARLSWEIGGHREECRLLREDGVPHLDHLRALIDRGARLRERYCRLRAEIFEVSEAIRLHQRSASQSN